MSDPRYPSRQIGDITITPIPDGSLTVSLDLLANIEPAQALALQRAAAVAEPEVLPVQGYLVRSRGRTVLIDAGGGIQNLGGEMQDHLRRAGVQAADIDAVLLTHAHPDHVGGLMDPAGNAAFPNAELIVPKREVAFWQDDAHLARASDRSRRNFQIARQAFDRYGDRLRPFEGAHVLPGISAVPLPGHTIGHTGYRIDLGRESLLVWGDIVHFPHIQIPRPQAALPFDQDATCAAATRARILDEAASDRLLIAGMHLGAPGFLRIERHGTAFRVVPGPQAM